MMTEAEKRGCVKILQKLSKEDLLGLKDTVTNKQITVEKLDEAMNVIITYSETAKSLLKRKKILRDILFKYLHDSSIVVSPSLDKNNLVERIVEFWNNQDPENVKSEVSGLAFTRQESSYSDNLSLETTSSYDDDDQNSNSNHLRSCDTLILERNDSVDAVKSQQVSSDSGSTDIHAVSNDDHILADTFITWFFKILNSHNPAMNQSPEDFGPHHFWNDVTLNLVTLTQEKSQEQFQGCDLVCQRFLAFVKEEYLLFNPNVSREGVKIQKDPHGLVLISVCGTVHRANDCLGTFQQRFGIIRDPRFQNNWKIKTSLLGLRCMQVTSVPKLENNHDLLALTES